MKIELENVTVTNNADARRFEVRIGDYFGLIDYQIAGKNIVFSHTEVPQAFAGQGVAGKMARTALDFAVENEFKIIPICPFIAAFIRRNPEYQPHVWGYKATGKTAEAVTTIEE